MVGYLFSFAVLTISCAKMNVASYLAEAPVKVLGCCNNKQDESGVLIIQLD
jgi:hypothetical protein